MEIIAWILLMIGAIIGVMLLLPIGFMFIFLFVMSFDAPNSTKKPLNWLVQILMFGIAIGLASLIPISVYFAYKAIQQGQHAHTILIMSLVLIPLFLALFYYLYTIRAANRPQSSS